MRRAVSEVRKLSAQMKDTLRSPATLTPFELDGLHADITNRAGFTMVPRPGRPDDRRPGSPQKTALDKKRSFRDSVTEDRH